ncbi:MAG: hypothetical protein J6X31_10885 [Bacteroidales bacterium]|nr:hypothetical protein [Bacteroidales bacterium]
MKRTYIQPQTLLVQVELNNIICVSGDPLRSNGEKTNVYLGNTASSFDAPRTRLWGNDED